MLKNKLRVLVLSLILNNDNYHGIKQNESYKIILNKFKLNSEINLLKKLESKKKSLDLNFEVEETLFKSGIKRLDSELNLNLFNIKNEKFNEEKIEFEVKKIQSKKKDLEFAFRIKKLDLESKMKEIEIEMEKFKQKKKFLKFENKIETKDISIQTDEIKYNKNLLIDLLSFAFENNVENNENIITSTNNNINNKIDHNKDTLKNLLSKYNDNHQNKNLDIHKIEIINNIIKNQKKINLDKNYN